MSLPTQITSTQTINNGTLRIFAAVRANLRAHGLMWLVTLVIVIYRLTLVPVGQGYQMDEGRYPRSSDVMTTEIAHGNVTEALRLTFMQQGRPFAGIIGLIPATVQNLLGATHVVVSVWNVLVTTITLWLLYAILCLYTPSRVYAAAGVAVFSLIHENSLFIRHMLSYDWALCIALAVLYYVLSREHGVSLGRRQAVLCGVACGIGFSTYPGYFPIFVAIGIVIGLFNKPRFLTLLRFLLGGILVIGSLEIISRLVGAWNIRSVVGLSTTVVMGDYSEGYSFAVSYLNASDSVYGLVLIALFCISLIFVGVRRDIDPRIRATILLAFLAYMGYGTLGVFAHFMVQYGRLVHMYMPFLVMGVVLTLISIPRLIKLPQLQWIVWAAVLLLGTFTFTANALVYVPLKYYGDILSSVARNYPNEKVCNVLATPDWQTQIQPDCGLVAINMDYLREDRETWYSIEPYKVPANWQPVVEAPHPVNYPPHRFTGYSSFQRDILAKNTIMMGIYRVGSTDTK